VIERFDIEETLCAEEVFSLDEIVLAFKDP
jgi:hypothetical protein